jgi:hypothetical protein
MLYSSNAFVYKTNSRRVSTLLRNLISFHLDRKYFYHNKFVFILTSTRRLFFHDWKRELKRHLKKILLHTTTRAANERKSRRNQSSFLITFSKSILLIHSMIFSHLTLESLAIIVIMFNSMSRKSRSMFLAFFLILTFNSRKWQIVSKKFSYSKTSLVNAIKAMKSFK